jgi:hypothetical protein
MVYAGLSVLNMASGYLARVIWSFRRAAAILTWFRKSRKIRIIRMINEHETGLNKKSAGKHHRDQAREHVKMLLLNS